VVRDVKKTSAKFAAMMGVAPPELAGSGDYAVTGTLVEGRPAPDAGCQMAFFNVGPNVVIEFIQPNDAKSTWRDFLDQKGEGIHHIAFNVKGSDKIVAALEGQGVPCVQRGKYGDGSGQYAYMDATADLKCILELLESF